MIHLSYTWIHLKGLKSVPDRGFWAQVYPGSLQMYLFAKKKLSRGMVNPVITQPARMHSTLYRLDFDNNMDNNFGFFNAKLYCEGALILVCVFVEL